jgi:hypothetical protein
MEACGLDLVLLVLLNVEAVKMHSCASWAPASHAVQR